MNLDSAVIDAPSPAQTDGQPQPFESLPAKAIYGFRIAALLGLGLPLSGLAIALTVLAGAWDLQLPALPLWTLVVLVLAAVLRAAWRLGERGYRATGYRLDASGLEIHRGIWWRSEVRVLRSRIQHTDLQRGPLDRRLGLADLELHTAGSKIATVKLQGLDADRAIELRDALLQGHDQQL